MLHAGPQLKGNLENYFDLYNAPPDSGFVIKMTEKLDKLLKEERYRDVRNYRFLNSEENPLVSKQDRLKSGCFSMARH